MSHFQCWQCISIAFFIYQPTAVAGAGGVLAPAFRPLKRSFPSSTVVSRTPSPKSHSDSDVNMTDIPGPPTIKRPRQS